MNIQSWMIKSWATLEWYLPPQVETLPSFKHMGTQLRDDGGLAGLRAGDTVWMAQDEQRPVGLAWEWVEVKPGVVMLADPNSIITNLQFVDDHQLPVYGLAKTVAVNRLVHALAWQLPVCDLLQQRRQPEEQGAHLTVTAAVSLLSSSLARPGLETQGVQPLLTRNLSSLSYNPSPSPNPLRRAVQMAGLHPVQSLRHRAVVETHRRAHSRASDQEDSIETALLRDQRRAA